MRHRSSSRVLSLAAGLSAAGLLLSAHPAFAQSSPAAPPRDPKEILAAERDAVHPAAPKVRVRVYLRGLRCLPPEYTQESGKDEVVVMSAFQGVPEAAQVKATRPLSIDSKQTKYFADDEQLVFDGVVDRTGRVAGAFWFLEDDGHIEGWEDRATVQRKMRAFFREQADRNKWRTPEGVYKLLDSSSLQLYLLNQKLDFEYAAGKTSDLDESLGFYHRTWPAAGKLQEEVEWTLTRDTGYGDKDAGEWRYGVMYRIVREGLNADGTPYPPAQDRPAENPAPPQTTPPAAEPTAEQLAGLRKLAGKYKTNLGTIVTVRPDGKYATADGVTEESAGSTVPRQAETWYLGMQADGTIEGLWTDYRKTRDQAGYQGRARLHFTADGSQFYGRVQPSTFGAPSFEYNGVRIEESENADRPDGFVGVDQYFAVRLDGLRRRRADLVEALVTVKNVSRKNAQFGAGSISLTADAPAAGVQFRALGNLYSPSGEFLTRLTTNPELTPGQTVQVRYVFDRVPETMERFKRLTVRGYGKEPGLIDPSGYFVGMPPEDGTVASLRYYDVRPEQIRRNAAGDWEAVLNVRNVHSARLGLGAGALEMFLIDTDGVSARRVGNIYSAANEGELVRVTQTLYLEPGESVRIRFHFANTKTLRPVRYRMYDGFTKTLPLPPGVLVGE